MSRATLIRILALSLAVLLPFQNCGMDYSAKEAEGLYVGDGYGDDDCISELVDCGPQQSFLQISIDLANPTSIATGVGNLGVYGRCNDGSYSEHYVHWELRNSANVAVDSGNESAVCIRGRYQFEVTLPGLGTFPANTLFTFFVSLVGIDDNGASFENLEANGSAEIDISRQ